MGVKYMPDMRPKWEILINKITDLITIYGQYPVNAKCKYKTKVI